MERYWNESIECMSREEMKKLQDERLVAQVKHVYENVPYYKKLMDEKGVTPDDINGTEDLHKLPFLTKADLREAILMACLLNLCQIASEFSLQAELQVREWLLSIHSMTLIYGKIAVQEQLLQPAERKMTFVRFVMAMACSQADRDLTEVLIK